MTIQTDSTVDYSPTASGHPQVTFEHTATGMAAVVGWPGTEPLLVDVCAMFESFGLRTAAHRQVSADDAEGTGSVHEFAFAGSSFSTPVLDHIAAAFEAGSAGRWRIDQYARLVATAGIDWREAVLVRAMCRFLRQTQLGFSETYLVDSLASNPDFVRALVTLFRARLDPARTGDPQRANAALTDLVDSATTLDEDRIRRALQAFVLAVVRTNWFQRDAQGQPKPYLSFKIDSGRLATRGRVVPFREIFVHSDEVEGIHVRSGAVARGGLRWSNRSEDFRTEVLGLMKTQSVKNAPIVPMGAKGAFVVRSADTPARAGYATFIRGLLDITDNIVDGAVVHPADTLCLDGEDAYLVVAADKGTATFSDLANGIAAEYNFWLGDAFASGGSAGYDHKAMGITARGAWLSVERHFQEAGHDIDTAEFSVVGIGDMSGDVFGNGMLLSRNIRLVGAFDHRHIFLDPDPDAAVSYRERERLFGLPTSSWTDYDREKISTGGGVWSRSAKSITLSPQVQGCLGIESSSLDPDELIQALLRAPVDLLWNGGIGTYVRAASETDVDAQDPANDRVRVSAGELRCAVIGEGGNLGLTQQARIDYAGDGGRINADFIDNAAGVATSDFEVNIKIALDAAVRAGSLSPERRASLLAQVADDVASRVLDDSASQILAISLASAQARHLLDRHVRLIGNLEKVGGINPRTEGLPSPAELKRRATSGHGLTRPEIAILLAQSKNLVSQELLASTVPDDEVFAARLTEYFPDAITENVAAQIAAHPLRREIIATSIADELINRVGPGAIFWLQERFGITTSEVASAYAAVSAIYELDALWERALEGPGTGIERPESLLDTSWLIEHAVSWLLRRRRGIVVPEREIDRFADSVRKLVELPRGERPLDADLPGALQFADTADSLGISVERVAEVHHELGQRLGIGWVVDALSDRTGSTHWDVLAAAAVHDDLSDLHHALTVRVLSDDGTGTGNAVAAWCEAHSHDLHRFELVVDAVRGDGEVDLAKTCAVTAALRALDN
ncbi:NAD-glutamate dehydrogenase domain-containing protein [Rhodococcus opacus]|uniref:NAD-glutamate dehydrogenase domain-containing protein n=1 Tax=Rhodococcus opacus TaxID=37919 RepID=UPI000AC7AED5|nr:NAD-glutamate dehydrogenase domain-containing protein [Rhodococcus opacus]